MITHTSITEKPVNFERCRACGKTLPPNVPRQFRVVIPDGDGPHEFTFRHLECASAPDKSFDFNTSLDAISKAFNVGKTRAFELRTAAGITFPVGQRNGKGAA